MEQVKAKLKIEQNLRESALCNAAPAMKEALLYVLKLHRIDEPLEDSDAAYIRKVLKQTHVKGGKRA